MSSRRSHLLAIVSLVLLPLVWLWPCVFGDRTFVPYDTAEAPPVSVLLEPTEVAAIRAGKNHDITEVPIWFLPELSFSGQELRAGRLPLWNPHARGGAPIHAYAQLGLCYPPNWLALAATDAASMLVVLAWISLAIAGLATLGLLRELGLGLTAAWFGSLVFQLSSPLAAHAFLWMHLASAVWLPALLWSLLRLVRHETLRAGPLAAVAVTFALPWLAGFPPYAVTSSVLGGLFALWLAIERVRAAGTRAALLVAARCALGFALGALLAMPQVLPSLLFFPESARSQNPTLAEIELSRFDTYGLLGYLLPDLISHPTANAVLPYGKSPLALWLCDRVQGTGAGALPNYNYTEYAVFFGTPALLLAGLGAFCGRGARRGFAISALLLLLALALFVPGVNQLFRLPAIQNVWPMRWLAHATLLWAWLAALGVQSLLEHGRKRAWTVSAAALLLAVGVLIASQWLQSWHTTDPAALAQAIAERVRVPIETVNDYVQGVPAGPDRFAAAVARAASAASSCCLWLGTVAVITFVLGLLRDRSRWFVAALAVLFTVTIVELALHGQPLLRSCELTHRTTTPVHGFLREQSKQAADRGGFMIARGSLGEVEQRQLPPGQLLGPGIRDLHFYAHFDARSIDPLHRLLGGEFGKRNTHKGYLTTALPDVRPGRGEVLPPGDAPPFAHPLAHPLLDLLGVRYVLSVEKLDHAGTRVGPELKGPGGEFFVYERPDWLPRAFAVPELRVLADDEAVLQAMVDPAFAPHSYALATAADAPGLAGSTTTAPPRGVRFVIDHPTEIELEVAAGEAPWLVLTDTYLPGWTATIDGTNVPIVRTDHAYRLVHLPATGCRVRFTYHSPGLATGLWLAGFATLVLLLITIWSRRHAASPIRS